MSITIYIYILGYFDGSTKPFRKEGLLLVHPFAIGSLSSVNAFAVTWKGLHLREA